MSIADDMIRRTLLWKMTHETAKLSSMLDTDLEDMTQDDMDDVVAQSAKIERMSNFYNAVLPPERDACEICVVC